MLPITAFFVLFTILYYDFAENSIRHLGTYLDDISVYSRIAYYNDTFGVENTRSFYNFYDVFPKIEIYHHFELWLSNIGNKVNGFNRSTNLLLFSFPVVCSMIYFLVKETFHFKSFESFGFIILLFFIVWPYDIINEYFNLNLPKGGGGALIFDLKHLLVVPIILSLIQNVNRKELSFFSTALALFFYPLLIPLVSFSIIVYVLLFHYDHIKKLIFHFVLLIIIISFSFNSGLSNQESNLFGIIQNLTALAKVFYVSLFTSFFSFGLIYFLLWKHERQKVSKPLSNFFIITLFVSIGLWVFFIDNIDANQLFRNLFIPLFSFLSAYVMMILLKKKSFYMVMILILIYILPFYFTWKNIGFSIPSKEEKMIASSTNSGDKILP